MLTISAPLSAGQAATYYAEAFANAREEYYAEGDRIVGVWHGHLRAVFGLPLHVTEEHFARLADGRHPIFNTPLIRRGQTVGAMEHRAGFDCVFSAPKSTSLVALVGGGEDVRRAHDAAVIVALRALEHYAQARMGGSRLPETTGKFIAAVFAHDSARPVNGYAAPQLHHHCVLINVTVTSRGKTRSLQPRELFLSQAFATAVYRSELAARLQTLGYAIERGRSGQPEIVGFTPEYLAAASPRRKQILELLAQTGRAGAGAAAVAALQTRSAKVVQDKAAVLASHHAMALEHGDQPTKAVEIARERGPIPPNARPGAAVSYATQRQFERTAVTSERALLTDALTFGMGHLRLPAVRHVLKGRIERGEFLARPRPVGSISRMWTTPAMVQQEQLVIDRMKEGQGQYSPLGSMPQMRGLTVDQREAVVHVLSSLDRVMSMTGIAGSGKTTALTKIRESAEATGYEVIGVAPTSRAAQHLAECGAQTQTLQRFIVESGAARQKRLVILDEASLASTVQMRALLEQLKPADRVLLVGDMRQHEPVDAGVPFRQLHQHGLPSARLTTILRQPTERLRTVVEHLAHGRTRLALNMLEEDGRIHVAEDVRDRIRALTAEAMSSGVDRTLIVVPDNETRHAINWQMHQARQEAGDVTRNDRTLRVLVPRQDMTATDRTVAQQYHVGDTVRFRNGSKVLKVPARSVGVVTARDTATVTVTIGQRAITYNPARLKGVAVYQDQERTFAPGDRIQFTAPDKSLHVANRQLGTLAAYDGQILCITLDSGKEVRVNPAIYPHLDFGYAMTSYSAQGLTADKVLVHIDAAHAGEMLVNQRLAYVALSRGREMAIYTDSLKALQRACGRDISHPMALQHAGHRLSA